MLITDSDTSEDILLPEGYFKCKKVLRPLAPSVIEMCIGYLSKGIAQQAAKSFRLHSLLDGVVCKRITQNGKR